MVAISEGAFLGNDAITSVTIPDSVELIGSEAFRNCKKMTIRSKKMAAINVDGECEYNTYAEFALIEKAVKIVVPKGIKSEYFEKNLATV